ncbi:MAG TPA: DNRLRE domain-containing protein [Candidatus Acidoferrales bacterium]|nr:DNRLRE domain-containing protein [Candidatus Acidoferrales bacterium]
MTGNQMNHLESSLRDAERNPREAPSLRCAGRSAQALAVRRGPSITRRKLYIAGVLLAALAVAANSAGAEEMLVLQRTTAGTQARAADSYMDQSATGTNHGTDTTFQVRSSNAANQRAIVEFDLSSIPSAGIKAATLKLFMSTAPAASRTYGAYRVTSRWIETAVTWASRLTGFAWGAAGGDVNGTVTTTTTTGTTSNTALSWTITADVQQWFGVASPVANYGTVIRDQTENSAAAQTAIFASMDNATQANRPSLTVLFVQNVQGLSSTAGNGTVALNWTYPAAIGTIVSATNGVLIVREAGGVIASTVVPTDGTAYTRNAGCTNNIGGATIVFSSNTLPTTFNDSATGDNAACPPVNGTLYAYKVFAKDAANNYSHSGTSSQFVALVAAMPNTTASTQLSVKWLQSTASATLAAPGILPGTVVAITTDSNIIFGGNPSTGGFVFNPIATDGGIAGRSPVLAGTDASIASNVIYAGDGNGFVYAVNATTGSFLWSTNPTASVANTFTAGPSVLVKKFATASYTGTHDLVVLGTRNAGTTTGNSILGLDGNTGAVNWTLTGNAGGNPAMDIVAATPFVDYVNNAVWVTSNSAGGTAQPSLWKVNPNTGARLATASLGNISNAPYVTVAGETLFVGTDAGTLYAINTATAATRASFAAGDTQVTGSVEVVNFSSPYTVIFSGATTVKQVIFNSTTNTFTTTGAGTWSVTMPGGCVPSEPAAIAAKVYVGCSDGAVYQIDVVSGVIDNSKSLRPGSTLGDTTVDVTLGILMVGSTNTRIYALSFPF